MRDDRHRQGLRTRHGVLSCVVIATASLLWVSSASGDLVRGKEIRFGYPIKDVAAADFNHDGATDLAVSGERSVTIVTGRGDGIFMRARQFRVGEDPQVLRVADLNRDHDKDIVSANLTSDNVSVLIGRGDGTFKRRRNYPVGDGPTYVDVGRLSRDRRPDLAVTNLHDGTVSLLINKGHGRLRQARERNVGGTPRSVAIAKLNGDRNRDLAIAQFDRIAILKGKGHARFRRARDVEMQSGLWELIAPDVNGDHVTDLAVTNLSDFGVSVLVGKRKGGFKDPASYGFVGSPTDLAVADITGGSSKDLIVEAEEYPLDFEDDPGRLYVLRGSRDGSFSDDIDIELDGDAGRFAVADFNGDGSADIAAITYMPAPKIELLLNE